MSTIVIIIIVAAIIGHSSSSSFVAMDATPPAPASSAARPSPTPASSAACPLLTPASSAARPPLTPASSAACPPPQPAASTARPPPMRARRLPPILEDEPSAAHQPPPTLTFRSADYALPLPLVRYNPATHQQSPTLATPSSAARHPRRRPCERSDNGCPWDVELPPRELCSTPLEWWLWSLIDSHLRPNGVSLL